MMIAYSDRRKEYTALRHWVVEHVASSWMAGITTGDIRTMIISLRDRLGKTDVKEREDAYDDYRTLLSGINSRTKPEDWYVKWEAARTICEKYDLSEVKDARGLRTFLRSTRQVNPEWNRARLALVEDIAETNGKQATLAKTGRLWLRSVRERARETEGSFVINVLDDDDDDQDIQPRQHRQTDGKITEGKGTRPQMPLRAGPREASLEAHSMLGLPHCRLQININFFYQPANKDNPKS